MGKENIRPSKKVWLVALFGTGAVFFTALTTLSPSLSSFETAPQLAASKTDHFISNSVKRIRSVFESDSPLNYLSELGNPENSVENVIPPVETPTFYADQYSPASLVVAETSPVTISVYLQALEIFMKRYEYEQDSGLEAFVAVDRWLESNSETDLKTISDLSHHYKSLAEDLITIPVPIELAESHRALVNNIYLSALALDDIGVTTENPTSGLFQAAHFTNYRAKQSEALIQLTIQVNTLLNSS